MKTLTITLPAYRCRPFIIECYNSIISQTLLPDWKMNLYIAVDGCPETAGVLQDNGIDFYYSASNWGHYVLRNTIMKLHPTDAYCYFDADDVMLKGYLLRTLSELDAGADIVLTGKFNCGVALSNRRAKFEYGGAMVFNHKTLTALGGFCAQRCAADSDFLERAKMAGLNYKPVKEPLYLRRKHVDCITKSSLYGYGRSERKRAWQEMTADRQAGKVKIKPFTCEFMQAPDFKGMTFTHIKKIIF